MAETLTQGRQAGRGAILVTGADGFVGRALLSNPRVLAAGPVRAVVRRDGAAMPAAVEVRSADLADDGPWPALVQGVDTVIHTAARVHVMRDGAADPLAEFRRVNVDGTLRLARHAAQAGVRRLIFLSSIKVNGEETEPGHPYLADAPPGPVDPYGISKHEAELGLRQLARETNLEVVIVRPVLVYGPGVRGNFASMMRVLQRGVPLPLGAVRNRRSLVAVGNLVDLIATCIDHPRAAQQTFLVSDGEDMSTTELLRRLGDALGRPARLLPVPAAALELAARVAGQGEVARRLFHSLQVDIDKTRQLLDWAPPVSIDEGLRLTAQPVVAK